MKKYFGTKPVVFSKLYTFVRGIIVSKPIVMELKLGVP